MFRPDKVSFNLVMQQSNVLCNVRGDNPTQCMIFMYKKKASPN